MNLDQLRGVLEPYTFECIPGCADCCGIVPMILQEAARVEKDKHPQPEIWDCQYLEDTRCGIYRERPFLCRLFGTTIWDTHLTCPHGRAPAVPLTPDEIHSLMSAYMELTGDGVVTTIGTAQSRLVS